MTNSNNGPDESADRHHGADSPTTGFQPGYSSETPWVGADPGSPYQPSGSPYESSGSSYAAGPQDQNYGNQNYGNQNYTPGYAPGQAPGQASGQVPPPYWAQGGPPGPPPGPRRRGPILIAVAAVVVVAAAAVAIALALGGSGSDNADRSPSPDVTSTGSSGSDPSTSGDSSGTSTDGAADAVQAPESFAGYQRLHNATAQRVESAVKGAVGGLLSSDGSAGQDALRRSVVAAYNDDGSQNVTFYFFASPTDALVGAPSDPAERAKFFAGPSLASQLTSYPTAAGSDAALQCGQTSVSTVQETVCVWSDEHTTGATYKINPATSPASVATTTEKLRVTLGG